MAFKAPFHYVRGFCYSQPKSERDIAVTFDPGNMGIPDVLWLREEYPPDVR